MFAIYFRYQRALETHNFGKNIIAFQTTLSTIITQSFTFDFGIFTFPKKVSCIVFERFIMSVEMGVTSERCMIFEIARDLIL